MPAFDHDRMPPKTDLGQRLQRYPQLQTKIESLLDIVENASGEVVKADDAEEQLFAELRRLGLQALQDWAARKQARLEADFDQRRDCSRKEKKDSTGTAVSALSR